MKKLLLISLCLSGCSSYQEGFDCPLGEGMPCQSVSAVHKKVTAGAFDENPPPLEAARPATHFGPSFPVRG